MTVLVTGGAGFVGGNLVRALLAEGRRVRATVLEDTRALDGLDVQRVVADTRDPARIREAMDGADVVFHTAAVISIDGDRGGAVPSTNVEGTRNVVAAALDAGVKRFVHFSSIHALEQRPFEHPIDEERPFAFEASARVPAYDRSKGMGEQEVRAGIAKGLDAVIVNPSAILGPFDFKPSRIGRVLLDVYHRSLPALVPGGFDWVDVRDVVAGALAAEKRGRTGERYLLSGHYRTVAELAGVIEAVTGVRPPRFTTPMWLAKLGVPFVMAWGRLTRTEPLYTTESLRALRWNEETSHEKASRELGHAPRPLEDTVRDAFAWFREVGMLAGGPLMDPAPGTASAPAASEAGDRP